ncbi:MAG: phospholipid carrier-dependent glycosyltransferase [Chloroflexi bacterium]|nr:phospholipid carrier-dependent glycosyltransferase [Chloroflexota bacterium]MBP7042030.1 phospholipid carrier-dependent glycosyltransferase [Chloroflexota bacterium]
MKERHIPVSWLITPLVLLFFWLAVSSMVGDSPTMDEQNHLARGLAFLRTGDPRLSLEHPPLVNALSALPVLTLPNIQLPTDDPSWQRQPPDIYWYIFAEKLVWQYNHDVTRMIFLARLPIVFLTLGLALVGFQFAREAWGRPSALSALVFLLFEPNLLAHGRYTTTDLGGTAFLFLAAYLLWRMWRGKRWSMITGQWSIVNWLLASVGLGLAFGSKLSTLIFVPIFGLMAVLPLYSKRGWRTAVRRLLQFLTAGLASIGMVWVIFGFEYGPFLFPAAPWDQLNHLSGPMPTFWAGIAKIFDLGSGGRAAFLLGEFSTEGFPAYFPIAFLTKTPLPILLLLPLAAGLLLWEKRTRGTAVFFLVPPLLYFLFNLQSGLNIGYRHLLPMLPFLLVLISGLTVQTLKISQTLRVYALRMGALWLLAVTLWIHPHYLSYFNVLAGGPTNGARILVDSNIDWGQDLLRLQQWMADNDVQTVKLGWFGTADPAYYGLNYEPMPGFPRPEFYGLWTNPPFNPAAPEPGVYAISVSSLWESHWGEKSVYPWFRAREPDARIGYSINIYDLR